MEVWTNAQEWETEWHGRCLNTYGEEEKQLLYANRMGLVRHHNGKSPYNFNMDSKSVVDIGGGPASLLLKAEGTAVFTVVEPMKLPKWVQLRYNTAGIALRHISGEEWKGPTAAKAFDEAWIYNVLQHTQDPELVIKNAQRAAKLIRIFEWVDTPTNIGHIHTLTEEKLNDWLGGYGRIETLTGQANCYGKCYYGIFPT